MMQILKKFTFEAAHHLAANVEAGHPYSRLHGHSFSAEIYFSGNPDKKTGWVIDFALIEQHIEDIKKDLDHGYLNDLEGLSNPTLENIAIWIWERLYKVSTKVSKVVVMRGSCGEGCIYEGP